MPNKAQVYAQMADDTARKITGDYLDWAGFLHASSRLYKYPFHDQLMIYAQRPDATACATYDLWNDTMHRYIRRGSKGIALLTPGPYGMDVRYVFDVSDTGTRRNSRNVEPWVMSEEAMEPVRQMLEDQYYADAAMGLEGQIDQIARQQALEYWRNHARDIRDSVDGSQLAEYDDFSIGASFRKAAAASISYSIQTRCGLDPELFREDFAEVLDWNTPATVAELGKAVSDISGQILRQIETTVRMTERSMNHERTYLQEERRLPSAGDGIDRSGAQASGQVRDHETAVPGAEPSRPVHAADSQRQADGSSPGDRRDGTQPSGEPDEPAYEAGGRDGGNEGAGSDGLGRRDERPEESGRRNDPDGADLRVSYTEPEAVQIGFEFPTEAEQIAEIDRQEWEAATPEVPFQAPSHAEAKSSAFSVSDEEIDHVLLRGSGFAGGRLRIAALYDTQPSPKAAQDFLKEEYGIGGHSHTYLDGSSGFVDYNAQGLRLTHRGFQEETRLRWPVVERHVRRLVESGSYLDAAEKQQLEDMRNALAGQELPAPVPRFAYQPVPQQEEEEAAPSSEAQGAEDLLDEIDPNQIREQLAQNGIVNGELVDPETLARNPFIQQVEADVAAIAAEKTDMEEQETPAEAEVPPLQPGERRIPAHDGIPAMREITIDLPPDEPAPVSRHPKKPVEEPPFAYDLHPGDTIYMDNRPFTVDEVRFFDVTFRDPAMVYPIFRAESKSILGPLLDRDERNRPFRTEPLPSEMRELSEMQPEPAEEGLREIAHDLEQPSESAENYRITDDHLGEGGQKTKFENNMRAIRTLKTLEKEHRHASPEDQEVISQYVGWGGIPQAFDERNAAWADEYRELKATLTPEEYEMARASTLNAHYTSPTVIRAIYSAVEQMGFRSGNILEPSCGIGNFFGLLPESMESSRLYGVELDSITGRIAQYLYPQANIEVTGFEKTDRKDFFDLAIGNVPFGAYKVADRQFDRYNFLIHDYFFAKALDQVRPGGIVAFITSKGTMDKQSPEVRKYIAQRAELLGAIRLPNTAFKANAGTEVTSDIIFLQKRDRAIDIEPDWVHLGQTEDDVPVNSYFADHPDMILGKMIWDDSMYGAHQETACQPLEGAELSRQLAEAITRISGTYRAEEAPELAEGEAIRDSIPADPNVRNYSYTVVDDKVYYRENSAMVHPDLNATAEARIKGMVGLRDCVHRLMDAQLQESDDYTIHELQAELNAQYDSFTAKYGLINSRPNMQAFSDDSSYYLLSSLEILTENGELERKADMFTKRTIRQQPTVERVDTAVEALAVSIAEKAEVNLPFMSELTGKSEEEIASDLTGVIFRLPAPAGDDGKPRYVTADEYLSGNVRQKLRDARAAAELSPIFEPNVKALEKAQPKDLDASEIDVRLGATWVDKEYIQQFMHELFEVPFYQRRAVQVQYSEFTSEWRISGKTSLSYNNVANNLTYGTDRASGLRILEDTLNLRDVRIYDTIEDAEGKEKRVLNQKDTTLAQQKQQAIKEAFRDWVWKDPDRREALVKKYNELFNSIRPREYDGQHITFSGMTPEITLREHQRNAIAHTIYGGNTLLAHVVGAGKTYEMIASAMESKRLGLCSKSMFVVPNHLTEQWASEFLRLYPSAKILVTTKKDFEKNNRRRFCSRIATGDYDAIIIGHSQFEKIPMSKARQERLLQEQIEEITQGIQELKFMRGEQFSIKQMERTRKQLEGRLRKLQAEERKDDVVTFEELGVDRLFVDEAHAYKNLFLTTKMRNVAGLSTSEAQKSTDMFLKCRYMDELTGGRGIVFATGTPISNSMTEMYTMQRYLQYGTLQRNNMTHFDAWASTFGETSTAIELAPEGTGYRARTRFSKFFNLPELMSMFKEVVDIKTADQLKLPTPTPHYETVVVQPTEIQKAMVQSLSERAGKVHSGSVDPRVDNMLKITSDGRKLGLDQRLINPLLPDDPGSKVNACINNIFRIWQDGADDRLTQLVFCDISTPKGTERTAQQEVHAEPSDGAREDGEMLPIEAPDDLGELASVSSNAVESNFNVYEDIRSKLIARGVPPEEIAFIHDANTEVKKKELFAKVRAGQVRVLLGSTAKMGAGTNCQDRLIALHDLDCPWRPGDLEQRSGRIIRQGNMNPEVQIYRYATEGTFDSYLWQTVENKQKFISQIMTSKSPVRTCEDIDEAALSYAEIKALCAGDPAIKEKMDLDVDVARLRLMKADHQSQQYRLEDRLLKFFPQEIERNQGYIRGFEQDQATVTAHPLPEKDFIGMTIRGETFTEAKDAGEAILAACKNVKNEGDHFLGEYRGFSMSVMYNPMSQMYQLTLKGAMSHQVELGSDPRGNITRIDNVLAGIPRRQQNVENKLNDLQQQMVTAKAELGKPFPQEEELRTKSARLAALDAKLNLDRPAQQAEKKRLEQER
ncbi:MAG: DEAD/DEAH box helicase family protein [Clostridia bacterium]|nr:DEAD/DEAH box helicase family protein [Clostridia bacterium]